jgi:hypothetical protein
MNIEWFNDTLQHGNMDSRKIILFILKVVARLDRELNYSSNKTITEGGKSDQWEIILKEKHRSDQRSGVTSGVVKICFHEGKGSRSCESPFKVRVDLHPRGSAGQRSHRISIVSELRVIELAIDHKQVHSLL